MQNNYGTLTNYIEDSSKKMSYVQDNFENPRLDCKKIPQSKCRGSNYTVRGICQTKNDSKNTVHKCSDFNCPYETVHIFFIILNVLKYLKYINHIKLPQLYLLIILMFITEGNSFCLEVHRYNVEIMAKMQNFEKLIFINKCK